MNFEERKKESAEVITQSRDLIYSELSPFNNGRLVISLVVMTISEALTAHTGVFNSKHRLCHQCNTTHYMLPYINDT